VIGRLRNALLTAVGRRATPSEPERPRRPWSKPKPPRGDESDATRRLDAAHRRLKSTIPPPQD
jgi:hypothetical protein